MIAPGGSVVYCENAMKHYKEIGKIVYLQVSFETINKRLRNAKSRGVVLRDGQTLKDLYEERVKLFGKICRCDSVRRWIGTGRND